MSVSIGAIIAAAFAKGAADNANNIGTAAFEDWLGDRNRQEQASLDWESYKKKSRLDWDYYSNAYAPFNQTLQKDMFDYTSAGNLDASERYYDYTYQKQLQSVADKKNALLAAGYNPILAVNGGLGAVQGSTIGSSGQLGAISSPHSASGVATTGGSPRVSSTPFSLNDILAVLTTAKSLDKMDADINNIKASTAKTIADTEKPGAVGQAERSLETIAKQIGENANSAWREAVDFIKNMVHPVKPLEYKHRYPEERYDKDQRRVIWVGDLPYDNNEN